MSQQDREKRLRDSIVTLERIAAVRPLFDVERRRLRELRADMAKIEARRARKAAE